MKNSGSPRFLSLEAVLRLHEDAIARYCGDTGIRDLGLLESALAQPRAMYGGEFLHAGLAEMAAAYVFHICKNHAFIDGNKRVAAYAAGVFLDMNGAGLTCHESEFEAVVLGVARGEFGKPAVAEFFRAHLKAT